MITLLNSLEGAIKNFFSGGDIMNFKKILIALAIAWAVSGSLVLPVFASDDLYGFQMKLGTYQEEASTGYHYRQTASNANPWKVGVYTSAEGNGSYYRAYLMGQKNRAAASPFATVYTGPGYPYVYTTAKSNANQTNVRLVMFNPEWTNKIAPYITGAWDEETW